MYFLYILKSINHKNFILDIQIILAIG